MNSEGIQRSISPTPQGPEGPFYLPNQPIRSDIRGENQEGLPFAITFCVKNCNDGGNRIENAEVHAWHADALGRYSAYLGLYPLEKNGNRITGDHVEPTDDSNFLRGIQNTNSSGEAVFQTVFPGWYGARTPHIHFKVFVNNKNCYTGEVYFEDSLTDKIIARGVKPYCDRDSTDKQTNDTDPLFGIHRGFKTVVKPDGDITKSISGTLNVIVSP